MVGVKNKEDLFYVVAALGFLMEGLAASACGVYSGGEWRSTAVAPTGGNFPAP